MDFSLQDDDFGGDFSATNATRASDSERNFGDLEDDEDDIFGTKYGPKKVEEAAPGVATGMILSLRESLQNCKDELASCQNELESAKAEINKWKSAFQNESFVPAGKSPEPRFLIDYIQNLKSSERSLKEQLEIAKRKEASCIVQYEKREQEMAELKSAVRDLKSQLKPASMQNLVEEKDKKEPFSFRGNALSSSSEEPLSLGEDDIPSYGEYLTGSVFLSGFRAEHLSNSWTPSVRLFGPDDLDIDSYLKEEYCWVINVEGYDTSLPVNDLKSALTNHFRSCGVILSCSFEEDGRLASIVMVGDDADKKALELNGSEAGGGKLVVKAKPYPEIKPTDGIPFGATVSS